MKNKLKPLTKQYFGAPKTIFCNLILAKLDEFRLFVPIQNKSHSKNIFENVQNYKFQAALQKTFTRISSAYKQNLPRWQLTASQYIHSPQKDNAVFPLLPGILT